MKIGIIGTGRMASGLGTHWANAGHEVLFGSREIEKAQTVAGQVGGGVRSGSYQDAVDFGDVVVLTVPWKNAQEVLSGLTGLAGKVLLEITNNFSDTDSRSTTERIMEWAPGAKVVKAFNTVFVQIVQTPTAERVYRPDVFMAGDDADAKAVVAQLVVDAGFDPFDAGPAASAHHLEKLAAFIVEMGYGRSMSPFMSYKVTKVTT